MRNKTKICIKCGKEYLATEEYFYIRNGGENDFRNDCKKCFLEGRKEYGRRYYINNREKINSASIKYQQKHKEETRLRRIEYRRAHIKKFLEKEKIYRHKKLRKEYVKKYYQQNKEKINRRSKKYQNEPQRKRYLKEYCRKNYEKISINGKKWFQKHKAEINERHKKRRKSDMEFKIINNLRSRVGKIIKSHGAIKSRHTIELVGCDIKYFLKHIESKFLPGMTWENYGLRGWHIDHIKPCAAFDLRDFEQQKECFNYRNLQPLWWVDNLKKNSFYNGKMIKKGDYYAINNHQTI